MLIHHNWSSVGILNSQNRHRKKDILKGIPLIYICLNASWEGALFLIREPVPSSLLSRNSCYKSIAICLNGYWPLSSATFLHSHLVWIFDNCRTILVLTLLNLCPDRQRTRFFGSDSPQNLFLLSYTCDISSSDGLLIFIFWEWDSSFYNCCASHIKMSACLSTWSIWEPFSTFFCLVLTSFWAPSSSWVLHYNAFL